MNKPSLSWGEWRNSPHLAIWHLICWLWFHLWNDKVPLIWNIALAVIATYGTYLIAPAINYHFERQKIKAEYVGETLKQLNYTITDFYTSVIRIRNGKSGSDEVRKELIEFDTTSAKLQWKAIEISAVMKDARDQALLRDFAKATVNVKDAIVVYESSGNAAQIDRAIPIFSASGVRVIAAVAERAEIKEP